MGRQFLSVLLVAPLLAAAVFGNPKPAIEQRHACNRDNVLRALVDSRYITQALSFCRTYISVPPTTITS